ncbi:MAG: fatty acid desaturase, partial [Deltaproteobacteria bacterium]|nr:fatty acid desaturase [Deltaproteobacteria bacterium]
LIIRIRSMAEHACTEKTEDQYRNTRTTAANILARLTVAPHHVNFHLEHHALMTAPHYRLPDMHRLLRARGVYETSPFSLGYWRIIRLVSAKA